MATLRYTSRARLDLIDIWVAIAGENPAAADALYTRLQARVQTLARFPDAGAPRPRIGPTARLLAAHPYLILYRATEDGVEIVRVVHGARRIGRSLFAAGLSRSD